MGGVLQGQELIKQANIRAQIAQFQEVNRAVNTFYAKYGQLPGDFDKATQFWGQLDDINSSTIGTTKTCNGNGDGNIGTFNGGSILCGISISLENEVGFAFQQLSNASLLASKFEWGESEFDQTKPYKKMLLNSKSIQSTSIGIIYSSVANNYILSPLKSHVLVLGGDYTGEFFMPLAAEVEPEFAFSIDSKLDDGKPTTGNVQSEVDSRFNGPEVCKDPNDLTSYDLTNSSNKCELFIKADF